VKQCAASFITEDQSRTQVLSCVVVLVVVVIVVVVVVVIVVVVVVIVVVVGCVFYSPTLTSPNLINVKPLLIVNVKPVILPS
jgi:hypothetical protein